MPHSRSFLANQKVRNAIVGAENLLKTDNHSSIFFLEVRKFAILCISHVHIQAKQNGCLAVVANDEFFLSCWVIFFDKLKIIIGLLLDHTKIHENAQYEHKNNLIKPVILSWLLQF